MGYDIEIRRLNNKNYTRVQIEEKNNYYKLNNISEEIEFLYISYNDCEILIELGIYPRFFNYKRIKNILPKYTETLEKLKVNEDVDKEIVKIYEDCERYSEFNEKYKLNYYYKSKTVIFIIVSTGIEKLKKCDENDFWISDKN